MQYDSQAKSRHAKEGGDCTDMKSKPKVAHYRLTAYLRDAYLLLETLPLYPSSLSSVNTRTLGMILPQRS
jgi:hypothetical protein